MNRLRMQGLIGLLVIFSLVFSACGRVQWGQDTLASFATYYGKDAGKISYLTTKFQHINMKGAFGANLLIVERN